MEVRGRLYRIWAHMLDRCRNPNNDSYKRYGGRGITVCGDWYKYKAFAEWAANNGYKDGLSIDRVNVNGNYCPDNCRWADYQTQANNRTNTRILTYNGETHTIAEWARITGLPYRTIHKRLELGFSEDKVLTTERYSPWGFVNEMRE